MHNLLFLEEYQERKDMSRYDLYKTSVEFMSNFTSGGTLHVAQSGFSYVKLTLNEEIFEGRRSVK